MQRPRSSAVDTIRAAALIGICVVNVPFMALPGVDVMGAPEGDGDRIAWMLVAWLFQSKFFLLFSFLFGWGMHVQMESAARAGTAFGSRYTRRLVGLAVLGALHAVLVFTGDILLLYAVLGALLWPLRRAEPRHLLRLARWTVPVAVVALFVLGLAVGQPQDLTGGPALGGGYREATLARLADWPGTFVFLLLFQGPLAYGAFLCGLAAAKVGFFEPGSNGQARLARAAPWLLVLGLALNSSIALAPDDESFGALAALLAIPLAAPILSAAWLHYLIRLDARLALPSLIVLAGRNSLTAYVLQGVIAGAIFGAYGLGLFGTLGQAALLPLSLGIALLAMVLAGALARLWGRAPLEHLLRWVTMG